MSFAKLTIYELQQAVWSHKDKHQEILNCAAALLSAKKIELWQVKNLYYTMINNHTLTLPYEIVFKNEEEKARFFNKLRGRVVGGSSFFWSGTPEGRDINFNNMVRTLEHLHSTEKLSENSRAYMESRILRDLINIVWNDGPAHKRISDITTPLLRLKEFPQCKGSIQKMLDKIEKHDFHCWGGGKLVDGKLYSNAALTIKKLLQAELSKDSVTICDYYEVMEKVKDELKNKREVTFGFFGIGKRDSSTVTLYKELFSDAEQELVNTPTINF